MTPPGEPSTAAPRRNPVLGCVADDITGASDLADALVQAGLATVQVFGVPADDVRLPACDAVVVALKSRTCPADDAVEQSLTAARWLRTRGTERTFFKYCSTFDSTPAGNIGPVADALRAEDGAQTPLVHCPAYPVNERTLYRGYLFVGDVLLSKSGMREHPLTPMTDANLVRVLGAQTPAPVGLLALPQVRRGSEAVAARLGELAADGVVHVLADALDDDDLAATAQAITRHPLAAGGAAFGAAWGAALAPTRAGSASPRPTAPTGRAAVLVGSASTATAAQVATAETSWPVLRLDPEALAGGDGVASVLRWVREHMVDGPVLVTADTSADGIRSARERFGDGAAARVEATLAEVAVGLLEQGVRRLVVAGGETSGAVAAALHLTHVQVGPQICPGVPWTLSGAPELAVAFKSGNFGGESFFADAFASFDTDAWEHP
ncbi:MAG: 3-oxo-tetronate kinase [Mycobacteriaceae bacterium]